LRSNIISACTFTTACPLFLFANHLFSSALPFIASGLIIEVRSMSSCSPLWAPAILIHQSPFPAGNWLCHFSLARAALPLPATEVGRRPGGRSLRSCGRALEQLNAAGLGAASTVGLGARMAAEGEGSASQQLVRQHLFASPLRR
jgi:hypothetical protein